MHLNDLQAHYQVSSTGSESWYQKGAVGSASNQNRMHWNILIYLNHLRNLKTCHGLSILSISMTVHDDPWRLPQHYQNPELPRRILLISAKPTVVNVRNWMLWDTLRQGALRIESAVPMSKWWNGRCKTSLVRRHLTESYFMPLKRSSTTRPRCSRCRYP